VASKNSASNFKEESEMAINKNNPYGTDVPPMSTTTDTTTNLRNEPIGSSANVTGSNRPTTIKDALRLIDDVINRDGANLRELLTSEYANLRRAINDIAPKMGDKVSDYGTQAVDQASVYAKQGMDQSRVIASKVDAQVRTNPWPIVGGAALAALAIGFFLGRGSDATTETDLH
jgi:ElaB/YqjD/DUF883 family membrane-anchored ribosome-binding protein